MRNTDPAFEVVLTQPYVLRQLTPGTDSIEHNGKNSTERHMELCIVKLASEIGGEKMNYSLADMEPTR